jgi:Lamin Tail Domain
MHRIAGTRRWLAVFLAAAAVAWIAGSQSASALVISEVMFNPSGPDDGREWIELFNDQSAAVDLSGYSLGWGGADYTFGTLALPSVLLAPGAYFVVGGPTSDAGNGSPTYDLAVDFNPDLQNPFIVADGIALFQTGSPNPIHVVIYGFFNFNNLVDESGLPGAVDVFFPGAAGTTLVWNGTSWSGGNAATPGTGTLLAVPETSSMGLTLLGLTGLAGLGTVRRRALRGE